jgi:excisionase family DNA binding protein
MTNGYTGPERRGDRFITPKQIARRVGVTVQTVTRWLRQRVLIGKQFGRLWRVDARWLRCHMNIVFDLVGGGGDNSEGGKSVLLMDRPVREYNGPERRQSRPVSLPRAAAILRFRPSRVLDLADELGLMTVHRRREVFLPAPVFRILYGHLLKAGQITRQ